MSMTLNDPRQPKTWEDANALLGNRDHMKIANNTWLHRDSVEGSDDILVRLHSTYIIRYHGQNSSYSNYVTLHSGGYQTVTTKQRMTMLTNVAIYQKDYVWYVTEPRLRNNEEDPHGLRHKYEQHRYIWFPSTDQNPTMEFADGDTYLNRLT